MTTSAVVLETRPELQQPKNEWCYLVLEHLDEFARLAWYLVVDTALVECVMVRVVARLENTPFSASSAMLAYSQARDTLIDEAISVLNLEQQESAEADELPIGPNGLCELPNLPRLAFLLKLVLLMPESQVARLLNVPASSVSELIGRAIFRLSHRLPDMKRGAIADA